jgi:hypothetical protein
MAAPHSESPRNDDQGMTDSSGTILVVIDGPGDTTPRPWPPNIPRYFPGREPPPELQRRPPEKPPDNQPPSPEKQ